MISIGQIEYLQTFPVVYFPPLRQSKISLTTRGVEGDKLYAFVDENQDIYFKWITIQDYPKFDAFKPVSVSKNIFGEATVMVESKEGYLFDIHDDRVLAYYVGTFKHLFELQPLSQTISTINISMNPDNIHTAGSNSHIVCKIEYQYQKIFYSSPLHIGSSVIQVKKREGSNTAAAQVLKPGIISLKDAIRIEVPSIFPKYNDSRSTKIEITIQ